MPNCAAFLSYVHSDDDHDRGRISKLRERLEGEVRMHMGEPFKIFQDRNDLEWGQNWQSRISDTLNAASFLIPVVTPSFFRSPACRDEFYAFSNREQVLGLNGLILPIYYLDSDEIENRDGGDIAEILKSRQWSDWRSLRFHDIIGPEVSAHLAKQALMIKRAMKEMNSFLSDISSSEIDEIIEQRQQEYSTSFKIGGSSLPCLENVDGSLGDHESSSDFIEADDSDYSVFTSEFDEEIKVGKIINPIDVAELGKISIKSSQKLRVKHGRQLRDLLSPLSKVIGSDTALLILADNSGSLRGEPVSKLAAWSTVVLELLEGLGVSTAFVGFTTRSWKGGQSREKWLSEGRPPLPGRLADIRYIRYKDFDETVVESVHQLGAMLKEGLLKENIDGEAVLWAREKIQKINRKNKIILVLSDGAPVDDSTLSVNPEDFLDRHLKHVVKIMDNDPVRLLAVGIDHDVSRYYGKNSIMAKQDNIGLKTLELLAEAMEMGKNLR